MENSVSEVDRTSRKKKTIDIIVPCYNEEQSIDAFYSEMERVAGQLPDYDFSYIFVDDGSSDLTLEKIKALGAAGTTGTENPGITGAESSEVPGAGGLGITGAESPDAAGAGARMDPAGRYISFSRNFGKEAAMYAGLKASTKSEGGRGSDYSVIIDADLQHPPELIKEMIKVIEETDCDSCAARRVSRKGEPRIRSFFARTFYKIMNRFCDIQIVDGAVDFRIMSRKMVKAVVDMPESQRFSKGIFAWVGFDTRWIEFENVKRMSGESKWTMIGLTKYAISGFVDFAEAPLKFMGLLGGIVSAGAVIYLIIEIIKTIAVGKDVPGYESLVCLILFFGGLTVTILSVIGQYIGRMYVETKRRPIYIEKESNVEYPQTY